MSACLASFGVAELRPWYRQAALEAQPSLRSRSEALASERMRILEELLALERFGTVSRQRGEYLLRAKDLQAQIQDARSRIPSGDPAGEDEEGNRPGDEWRKAHRIAVQEHEKTVRALEAQGERVWTEALEATESVPAGLRERMVLWSKDKRDVEDQIALVAISLLPDWETDLLAMEDPTAAYIRADGLVQSNEVAMAELAQDIQRLQRAAWEREPLRSWAVQIHGLQAERSALLQALPSLADLARKEEDLRNFRSAVDTLLRALQTSPHSMQVASFGLMTSAWSAVRDRLGDEMALPSVPDLAAFSAGEPDALAQWQALREAVARMSREQLAEIALLGRIRAEAIAAEAARDPALRALSNRISALESQCREQLSELPDVRPLAARLQLMDTVQARLSAYRTRFQQMISANQPSEPQTVFPE